MEGSLQLNSENFPDARQGHFQGKWLSGGSAGRGGGGTEYDGGRGDFSSGGGAEGGWKFLPGD